MPPRCQQRLPAETPARMTPSSQASRIASSTPCRRQSARRFATDPPPTQTRSLAAEALDGIGGGLREELELGDVTACGVESLVGHRVVLDSSPLAVLTRQTRGRSFFVSASALEHHAVQARRLPWTGPGNKPPEVARIRGVVIDPFYPGGSNVVASVLA